MFTPTLDDDANNLLNRDPLALLIGMLLDQQIQVEKAFIAPLRLKERLDVAFNAKTISTISPERLKEIFAIYPALHRFPALMSERTHNLCSIISVKYHNNPSEIWDISNSARDIFNNINNLPGFGEEKSKIFIALLGKQFNLRPRNWAQISSPYGERGTFISVADVNSPEALNLVKEFKRSLKAKK